MTLEDDNKDTVLLFPHAKSKCCCPANLRGLRGVVYHGDFGARLLFKGIDYFFQPCGCFIVVTGIAALLANTGRHVSDNDNALAYIHSKSGKAVFHGALAHKADHLILLRLKSSVHSNMLGKYAVSALAYFCLTRAKGKIAPDKFTPKAV